MIGITTVLYDLLGVAIIPDKYMVRNNNVTLSRRVSSVKTLDGGSFVSDFGHSETDDDLIFEISNLPKSEVDKLKNIIKLHSLLIVTTPEGAFSCNFKRFTLVSNVITLTFVVRGVA